MNNRQSIRLKNHDYGKNGYYFVTVDTWSKRKLFGELIGGKMILNGNGIILKNEIVNTPKMRVGVKIHTLQIMPDHWHAIIYISNVGARCFAPKRADGNPPVHENNIQKLANIVAGIKMAVSKELKIKGYKLKIWQRGYYERIVRNEAELERIRKYILENPEKWRN